MVFSVLGKETLLSASQLLQKDDPSVEEDAPPIAVRLVLDRSRAVIAES